jgi:putative iron-dependent peroxidase
MAVAQTAICRETGNFGLFITLSLGEGSGAAAGVRKAASALPKMTAALAERLGEPTLCSALGIGALAWDRVMGGRRPRGLVPFEPLSDGKRHAPATPADLFVHIHSYRHDANMMLAREFVAKLAGQARVVEEVMGFKHLGGRDLTGFVDGTENPKGIERAQVALVGEDDAEFAGGSHVSIQRWVHDLSAWDRLPVPEQEKAVGRTKDTDEELDDAVKPPSAHIARVVIEDEAGEELEIVRHSLPYGGTREHGLYFVAYCASPSPFRQMLKRMIVRDGGGHYDRLMDFTRPVTGASFFVPSVGTLESLGA